MPSSDSDTLSEEDEEKQKDEQKDDEDYEEEEATAKHKDDSEIETNNDTNQPAPKRRRKPARAKGRKTVQRKELRQLREQAVRAAKKAKAAARAEEQDEDYVDEDEEEEEENLEEKRPGRKRRTEGRSEEETRDEAARTSTNDVVVEDDNEIFTNDCMPKNPNGKVEISRISIHVHNAVTEASIKQLLGARALTMSRKEIEKTTKWYKQMRSTLSSYAKERAIEMMIANARTIGSDLKTFADMQKAWKDAGTEEAQLVVGAELTKITTIGTMEKNNFRSMIENEFMEKYNLVYCPFEKIKCLGCVARFASKSKGEVTKRLLKAGKIAHETIVSKRAPNRVNGEVREKSKHVGQTFVPTFVRKTQKLSDEQREKMKDQRAGKKAESGLIKSPKKVVVAEVSTSLYVLFKRFCV
jgi:hypothetical protein